MAATTVGATTVEVIYCPNIKSLNEDNEAPATCQLDLATRIQAFRTAYGAPTAITTFVTKTAHGDVVFGALLVK